MTAWEQVLDELVRARGRALVRYATLLTGDEREGEDLVQDALVRCFSQGRPIRDPGAPRSRTCGRRSSRSSSTPTAAGRAGPRSATCWPGTTTPPTTGPPAPRGSTCRPRCSRSGRGSAPAWCSGSTTTSPCPRSPVGSRISDGTVKRYLFDAIGQLESLLGPLPDAHTIDIQLVPTGVTR